jgi:hypothetical protein
MRIYFRRVKNGLKGGNQCTQGIEYGVHECNQCTQGRTYAASMSAVIAPLLYISHRLPLNGRL